MKVGINSLVSVDEKNMFSFSPFWLAVCWQSSEFQYCS